MDVPLGMLLHKHLGRLPGAVVRAGEKGGQSHHIDVPLHRLKGVQIVRRRGTGGVGGLLRHGHGVYQRLGHQGFVVPELGFTDVYGKGNAVENTGLEQLGAEVAAAVNDNFETHK